MPSILTCLPAWTCAANDNEAPVRIVAAWGPLVARVTRGKVYIVRSEP